MAIMLSAFEVINVAVEIEKNGYRFYTGAAKTTRNIPVADTFRFLAEEENKHQKTFEELLKNAPHAPITESYPGELNLYLKAIADAILFKQEEGIKKVIAKTVSEREALDMGIQAEKDSILYYQEILRFVSEKEKTLVEKVITEEKNHLVKLNGLYGPLV